MKVIGLTGGVGSGKSLVAQFLKEETGAELILTDDIGHIVTDKGGSAFEAVVEDLVRIFFLTRGRLTERNLRI